MVPGGRPVAVSEIVTPVGKVAGDHKAVVVTMHGLQFLAYRSSAVQGKIVLLRRQPTLTSEDQAVRDDELRDELPEAVPLYRIAPWWRPVAVFAVLGVVGLFGVAVVLGVALVQMENRQRAAATIAGPVPPPMVFASPAGGGRLGSSDEAPEDPQNLPYPVDADLAVADPYALVEDKPPAATARQRFLELGTDVWKLKSPLPEQLAVSPDGQNLAYIVDGKLTAGQIGGQRQIAGTVLQRVAVPAIPGMRGGQGYAAMMTQLTEIQLWGPASWSPNNFVYCTDGNGHLRRLAPGSDGVAGAANSQPLPFGGDSPAPVPPESEKVVFVRSQARSKLEAPGASPVPDFTEVVLGDLGNQEVRVLVPASPSRWRDLAVSPDGKRLALVSDRGHEGERPRHLRVFVLDLAGGEPMPLTPPASQAGPVCWTADGQALVYARGQEPLSADHWEDEPNGPNGTVDLYQWDFAANRETRLSRGGGCFSPSVTAKDDLYYLAVEAGPALFLRRISLATAREFAAREPRLVARDAEAWTQLFHRVLEESHLIANLHSTTLTPETAATLTEAFNKVYRERFRAEPPSTLKALYRQRRELEQLNLSPDLYPTLTLILGALEGEHLVHRHGARWRLTSGPLLPIKPAASGGAVENPFVYVINPFAWASAWARRAVHLSDPGRNETAEIESLIALIQRAQGRTLVLANDSGAVQVALRELADPDFGRGQELLQQGKGEEAERVLQEMLKQKRHEKNLYLNLQIAKLLYDHHRQAALERMMEHQCDVPPRDARKFNLLGLVLLDAQPQQAINAFKTALRCDIRFGPAYLNLAEAYQRANDLESARLCLRRYLAILPDGVYAADARRRLAAVDTQGN
jgi:tetratricopeptide (TPR) repeat protein